MTMWIDNKIEDLKYEDAQFDNQMRTLETQKAFWKKVEKCLDESNFDTKILDKLFEKNRLNEENLLKELNDELKFYEREYENEPCGINAYNALRTDSLISKIEKLIAKAFDDCLDMCTGGWSDVT